MTNLLSKYSNWKLILPAFLGMVYCIYSFQNAVDRMSEIASKEVTMIDMKKDYDADEINSFFTRIGEEGRAIHEHSTGVVDMIFPIFYGLFFILVAAFFIKKTTSPESKWMYLSLFPLLILIFDYIENFNTLEMLRTFPNLTSEMVEGASKITGIKSALVDMTMGMVFVLGMIFLGKTLLKKVKK